VKLVSTSDLTRAIFGPYDICLLHLHLHVCLFVCFCLFVCLFYCLEVQKGKFVRIVLKFCFLLIKHLLHIIAVIVYQIRRGTPKMTVPRGPGWSLSGTVYSDKYSVVPTSRHSVYATDWTSGIGDSQQGKTHHSDWLWCRTISVYSVLRVYFLEGKSAGAPS
jgi:hypothetical protein